MINLIVMLSFLEYLLKSALFGLFNIEIDLGNNPGFTSQNTTMAT